jgi:hypothetical protein
MNSTEANEVLAIIQRIGPVVLSAATVPSSSLRRAVAMMMNDPNMVDLGTFQLAFGICVDLARNAGATLPSMNRVRLAGLAETPLGGPAVQTVHAIERLALAQQSRIISAMAFTSRDEVDQVATAVNEAFTPSEENASDDLDQATYVGLITLHGSTIAHLAQEGRQLPRVVLYSYQAVMPALRMAQRAYGDPSRAAELIAENSVVHPAFMPRTGRMLAV